MINNDKCDPTRVVQIPPVAWFRRSMKSGWLQQHCERQQVLALIGIGD